MKKKVLIHTLYFGFIGLVFGGILAIAGNVSIPYSFTSGTTAKSSEINANFQALADAINNCPSGMVKVGPICVDIYEASVWDAPDDTATTQYGVLTNDYPCDYTGDDCSSGAANPIYARSIADVNPSRYTTWAQAVQACANSGKRLLTGYEAQMAKAGTPDGGPCLVSSFGTTGTAGCVSNWGVYDLVGNVDEWIQIPGVYSPNNGFRCAK